MCLVLLVLIRFLLVRPSILKKPALAWRLVAWSALALVFASLQLPCGLVSSLQPDSFTFLGLSALACLLGAGEPVSSTRESISMQLACFRPKFRLTYVAEIDVPEACMRLRSASRLLLRDAFVKSFFSSRWSSRDVKLRREQRLSRT